MEVTEAFRRFIKQFFLEIALILTALIITVIFPVLLLILSPVLLFRLCIIKLAKHFKPNLGKILHARSALMTLGSVYEDPKCTIVMVINVKGTPDIRKAREAIELKLLNASSTSPENGGKGLLFPELKQNLVYWMGFLFWRSLESTFKLEDHVYNYVPEDGERLNSQKLKQFVSELTSKSWSRDKALWEMIVIPNISLNSGSRQESVVLLRLHHGMVDGFSALKIIGCLDESNCVNQDLDRILTPGQKESVMIHVFNSFQYFLRAPYDLAKNLFRSPDDNPWNLKGRKFKGYSCGATSQKIDLKEFRDTKNSFGVGFMSLLIAVILGGIRETIKTRGDKLPKALSVTFPLPLPGHSRKLRNRMTFGSILVDLTEEDSFQRIKSIPKCFEEVTKSTIPLSMSWLCILAGSLFPWMIEPLVNKSLGSQYAVISNIPGPSTTSDVFGHTAVETFFTCSTANTAALAFAVLTSAGDMRISVGADSSILPTDEDARDLIANIQKEFELLRRTTV